MLAVKERYDNYTVIDESSIASKGFSLAHYRQLAEFRFQIRHYLQYSERVARVHGVEPQQHQLMLAIKGLPGKTTPTVSALANRLCLRHHSTVELINRLVERGAAVRKPSQQDRRQVLVELTPAGEELLNKLNEHHAQELQTFAPELVAVLTTIIHTPASHFESTDGNGLTDGHGPAADGAVSDVDGVNPGDGVYETASSAPNSNLPLSEAESTSVPAT